uniref:Thaumatin-like protein n=1 Tax=Salix viminalis TaxID=40686 RepID=A0A6N2MLZ2_SALVM
MDFVNPIDILKSSLNRLRLKLDTNRSKSRAACTHAGAQSVTFSFTNKCPYTVWPGTLTAAGRPQLSSTGFTLATGASFSLSALQHGLARTQCSTSGKFVCATADCASGVIECNGAGAIPPASLAEFTLRGDGGKDFYDISLVDGFNIPISITPQGGSGCQSTSCAANVNAVCDPSLAVRGADGNVIACKSACAAFNQPQYCCTGAYSTPETCPPTQYSMTFKQKCPQAYSYAYDDRSSTFTCPVAIDRASFSLSAPATWSGRFWARTQCSTSGKFVCATADCASGVIQCNGAGAIPPASLAEFTLRGDGGKDFYDISLVDGFNIPISITPQGGSGCKSTSCAANVNAVCDPKLAVRGADGTVIACKSACAAFNQPQYCCTGAYSKPETCPPTQYSRTFKQQCPQAYSYAYDDKSSTFTCPRGSGCQSTSCAANVNAVCDPSLAVRGADGTVIACKSACVAFNQPQYCCTGPNNTPETCPPTQYSMTFKQQCPQAYSYAYDDKSSTFTCPSGGNYLITFCP